MRRGSRCKNPKGPTPNDKSSRALAGPSLFSIMGTKQEKQWEKIGSYRLW